MANVRPLSNELQNKSIKVLNENPKKIKEDIESIRKWLKKQPHLVFNLDDQIILTFLRGCKFNYEITKQKLDAFYSIKTLISEYFSNRDPFSSDIQCVLKNARFWLPLPKSSDPLAPRLFYHYGKPFEASENVDFVAFVKTTLIILEILLHEDDSFIINGYSVIQYANGFSPSHLPQITIKMIKDTYTCILKRYPLRLQQILFMDAPSSVRFLYNLSKPFFSQKFQSRVHFYDYDDYKKLHSIYPKHELPIELGGESYSVQTILAEWISKIEGRRKWLVEDEKIRSDEAKRIANINGYLDCFGVDGSFKKIEID
ncbi:hypothetical protein FQR65_LT06017 [Abscondita terminalis]|nr:hypothetical protein FQR65_LT06017 [Abscondita terminalis]